MLLVFFFFFFFLDYLTIYVSVELSGICLYITYQVIHIQIMLLFNASLYFYFPSQRLKFRLGDFHGVAGVGGWGGGGGAGGL